MHFKIDTKERFHEIIVDETHLAANMAASLSEQLEPFHEQEVKNIILILRNVQQMDMAFAEALVRCQQHFYDRGASFVVCEVKAEVEQALDDAQLLEVLNLAPTLSEAWDIVQMEEIERELFD